MSTIEFRTNTQIREAMTPRESREWTSDKHELRITHEDGGGYRFGLTTDEARQLLQQLTDADL